MDVGILIIATLIAIGGLLYLEVSLFIWTLTFFLIFVSLLFLKISLSSILFFGIFFFIFLLLSIRSIRIPFVTQKIMARIKTVLPTMSKTEEEAIEAGDTWWETDLFRGR